MDLPTDFVYLRKLLMTTQIHYQNPHREAMMLRMLWTYDKAPNKEREIELSKNLLEKATTLLNERNEPQDKALTIVKKGLHMNPRSHQLYALRGEICTGKGDWQGAIKWYETARKMLKFCKISNGQTITDQYNEKLRDTYRRRGEWHEKNERLIEAVADYEQVLVLHPKRNDIFQVQDMLLKCLRKVEKYEAYRLACSEFMKGAGPQRTSNLMTQHAEFKIHIREIPAARRMLREALSLDKDNMNAQDLLQVIFDIGHAMLTNAIIWCFNGCYDKALTSIDGGADCDPYNPGFTVLKTIVLRISGRLKEAMQWLDNVNNAFYKLLEPSLDKRGPIMGNLTIDQTRAMLINQWYLIRYDMALEDMINGRYESVLKISRNDKLLQKCVEPRVLMGDCFMHEGKLDQALKEYLKAYEDSISTGCLTNSEKNRLIAQRIVEILNSHSRQAIQIKRGGKSLKKPEDALKVLKSLKIPLTQLGSLRSEALIYDARSDYQSSETKPTYQCRRKLADGLSFGRGVDDGGIGSVILENNANLENFITCSGTKKKFPYCAKILMQN